jgi:hypothetical protein
MVALPVSAGHQSTQQSDRAFFPHGVVAAGIRHQVRDHIGQIGSRTVGKRIHRVGNRALSEFAVI